MFEFMKRKNTAVLLPWAGKEPIYSYIKRNLDADGKLPQMYEELPDSEEYYEGKEVRWAEGAMDGVFSHHVGAGDDNEKVLSVSKLIRQQVAKLSGSTRRNTYLALMDDGLLGYIDPLLKHLRKMSDLDPQVLYEEARWFASEGAHRGVVKVGIALLGLFNCERDEELLMTLGKSEEFTLYVSVAIRNGFTNYNQKLFELAKCVHGWGKIHLVERLEADTDEIKGWLLRHGCDNSIMPEYLAYTCAVNGELDKALSDPYIDRELYEGAGLIISALISGGPAEDMDDYDDSLTVITGFLRHAAVHCSTPEDLLVIFDIKGFLEQDEKEWERRLAAGWSNDIRSSCLEACKNIISRNDWTEIVLTEIGSADNVRKHNAVRAANMQGIDIWHRLFEDLAANPLDDVLYYELTKTDDKERMLKLISFAEGNLPLKEIAAGPGNALGLGPDYRAHSCLDFILQGLGKFEGTGVDLVLAGLQSPVIRNRNMAIKALESWDKRSWPESITKALLELSETEPDADVKERIDELLKR